ncbi:MAG TPA: DUF721 domain-containing protein [Thermodesulfovibrionales bacterium]|nr:DUF721 domain-containing protein [Thermodesulfovibrionales bacterium]
MKRIGSLISPLVKSLGIEGALRLEGIRGEWAVLFGEPLSLHMSPVSLRNDELLIAVDSPVWLQQISFYRKDIIEKLRPFHVAEVRFRLGKIRQTKDFREKPASPPAKKALDKNTLRFIEQTLSGIEDDALRKSIGDLMERAFSQERPAV